MKAGTTSPQNKKSIIYPGFQCDDAEEDDTQTLALLTDYLAQLLQCTGALPLIRSSYQTMQLG